jgi:flagellar hook-basal body complex protein FliE
MKIMAPNPNLIIPQGTQGLGTPAPKENFNNILNNMLNDVNQQQQDSDQKIAGSLAGKEDLHETMLSLEKANLGLKVLIQVRNKILSAYDELNRMPL